MVREKTIKFNGVTINKFYNIQAPENDALATLDSNKDLDEVARVLCGKEVHWTMVRGAYTSFITKELLTDMKIWHHFMWAKLCPTSHLMEVTWERALILYAIAKGLSINVGC